MMKPRYRYFLFVEVEPSQRVLDDIANEGLNESRTNIAAEVQRALHTRGFATKRVIAIDAEKVEPCPQRRR
jgi:hypothetical protein